MDFIHASLYSEEKSREAQQQFIVSTFNGAPVFWRAALPLHPCINLKQSLFVIHSSYCVITQNEEIVTWNSPSHRAKIVTVRSVSRDYDVT